MSGFSSRHAFHESPLQKLSDVFFIRLFWFCEVLERPHRGGDGFIVIRRINHCEHSDAT
jgi:hypothetical protein